MSEAVIKVKETIGFEATLPDTDRRMMLPDYSEAEEGFGNTRKSKVIELLNARKETEKSIISEKGCSGQYL